jgi:hypothetical protein
LLTLQRLLLLLDPSHTQQQQAQAHPLLPLPTLTVPTHFQVPAAPNARAVLQRTQMLAGCHWLQQQLLLRLPQLQLQSDLLAR